MAAKSKKILSTSVRKKASSWRMMDGFLILLFGCVGSMAMYMYQDVRQDVNLLIKNQEVFRAELAPKMGQEMDSMRTAIREIYQKMNAPKKVQTAPAPGAKPKRTAWDDTPSEEIFSSILDQYQTRKDSSSSRSPASQVNGQNNGKSMSWVYSQIGLCFSWLMIISGLIVLIVKMLEVGAKKSEDN